MIAITASTPCIERARIARHFEGRLDVAQERAMREHLFGCDDCRRLYERHMLLSRLDPQALKAEERLAQGLAFRTRTWRRRAALATGMLAAAAAASLLWFGKPGAIDADFHARGGPVHAPLPTSRVFAYDLQPAARLLTDADPLRRHDELAFAYENPASKPRLMIFGVDEHRHVYWFYPAWTNETDTPVAVPIETTPGRHELGDAVRHDFDGTRLELHEIFLDSPLTVREVEAMLGARADASPGSTLSIDGAVEQVVTLTLTP